MHQEYSPDCWLSPETLPACMEIGLGPEQFDCSGFVLRTLADVTGYEIEPEFRHSRQIWADAQAGQRLFVPADEAVGNLAVYAHVWDTPEGPKAVPAHVSIVTAMSADGQTRVVHSRTAENRVAETIINRERIIGFVAIRVKKAEAKSTLVHAGSSAGAGEKISTLDS